jgi:hypothetical protein
LLERLAQEIIRAPRLTPSVFGTQRRARKPLAAATVRLAKAAHADDANESQMPEALTRSILARRQKQSP